MAAAWVCFLRITTSHVQCLRLIRICFYFLLILSIEEYANHIPKLYATLVHQGKGTKYPR